jgi:hypothetical protein
MGQCRLVLLGMGALFLPSTAICGNDNDPVNVQKSTGNSTCSFQKEIDNDDATVTWLRDATNGVVPQIEIRPAAKQYVAYWLEGRVHFGTQNITWTDGPYSINKNSLLLDITLPKDAFINTAQKDYLSDLIIRLVIEDENGIMDRIVAERMRIVFLSEDEPLIMDEATADMVAPAGVYSASERAKYADVISDAEKAGIFLEIHPPIP